MCAWWCALALTLVWACAGAVAGSAEAATYRDAVLADQPINYWRFGEAAAMSESWESFAVGGQPAWASKVGTWTVQSWDGTKALRSDTDGNSPGLAIWGPLMPAQRTVSARLVDVAVDGTNQPHPGIVVAYGSLSSYDAVYCRCSTASQQLVRWSVRSGVATATVLATDAQLTQGAWHSFAVRLDDTGRATIMLDGMRIYEGAGWLTGTRRVGAWSYGAGEAYFDDFRVTPLPVDEAGPFIDGFESLAVGAAPTWFSSSGTFAAADFGGSRRLQPDPNGPYAYWAVHDRQVPHARVVAARLLDTDPLNAPHPGIVVAWQDASNYDAVYLRSATRELMHFRVRGGVISAIVLNTGTVAEDVEHAVSVRLDNSGTAVVTLDGTVVSTTTGWLTNTNRIGVYGSDPGVGYIDDLRVSSGTRLGHMHRHAAGAPGMTFGDGNTSVEYDGLTALTALDTPMVRTNGGGWNTAEFWMYWGGGSGQMPFSFDRYDVFTSSFGGGSFGFNTGMSDVWGTSSAGLAGRWVHVAAIFNNGNSELSRLFIDGVEQSLSRLNTVPTARTATADAQVGGWPFNRNYRYSGRVDEVAIYDKALSPTRIAAHYDAGHHPPLAPTALTQFRSDGTTAIASGQWTTDGATTNLVLRFSGADPNTTQTLVPWVEVRPSGTPFSSTCGAAVSGVTFSGPPVSAPLARTSYAMQVNVSGLSSGTWSWRACTVDQTGQPSPWVARGSAPDLGVDVTAPTPPAGVADGTGTDVSVVGSMTTISANWSAGTDAHSGLQRHEYCIATSADCATGVLVSWTSVGTATSVTRSGLVLANGATYYTCVRTFDAVGNQSATASCSNGQATPALTATAASPHTLVQGATGVTVSITGGGFQAGATVTVGGAGVTVGSVTVASMTRVDAVLTIAATAPRGVRSMTVANPNGSTVVLQTFGVREPSMRVSASVLGHGDAARATHVEWRASVLADGPAAYWPLGDVGGASAADSAGVHVGSITGDVARSSTGAVPGDQDTAFGFAGSGHVAVADAPALRPAAVSVEAWVRPDSLGAARTVVSKQAPSGAGSVGYALQLRADGRYAFTLGEAGAAPVVAAVAATPTAAGAWAHVVGTWDGSTARIFVDGSAVGSAAGAATITSTEPLRIGRSAGASAEWFVGRIDEVAVYPAALSAARVSAHHGAARGSATVGMGQVLPGQARTIGPAGSGQVTSGPAVELSVTAESPWSLQVAGSDMVAPSGTIPAGSLSWRVGGSSGPWTALSTGGATVGSFAPGSTVVPNELRVDVPETAMAGSYAGSITYTALPSP